MPYCIDEQHPLNADGTRALHCTKCGSYEDDVPESQAYADYLCESCESESE